MVVLDCEKKLSEALIICNLIQLAEIAGWLVASVETPEVNGVRALTKFASNDEKKIISLIYPLTCSISMAVIVFHRAGIDQWVVISPRSGVNCIYTRNETERRPIHRHMGPIAPGFDAVLGANKEFSQSLAANFDQSSGY